MIDFIFLREKSSSLKNKICCSLSRSASEYSRYPDLDSFVGFNKLISYLDSIRDEQAKQRALLNAFSKSRIPESTF